MNPTVMNCFGPGANFFDSIEEADKAIDFYYTLDETDLQPFLRLIRRTPIDERLSVCRAFRASFKITDEQILQRLHARGEAVDQAQALLCEQYLSKKKIPAQDAND